MADLYDIFFFFIRVKDAMETIRVEPHAFTDIATKTKKTRVVRGRANFAHSSKVSM